MIDSKSRLDTQVTPIERQLSPTPRHPRAAVRRIGTRFNFTPFCRFLMHLPPASNRLCCQLSREAQPRHSRGLLWRCMSNLLTSRDTIETSTGQLNPGFNGHIETFVVLEVSPSNKLLCEDSTNQKYNKAAIISPRAQSGVKPHLDLPLQPRIFHRYVLKTLSL